MTEYGEKIVEARTLVENPTGGEPLRVLAIVEGHSEPIAILDGRPASWAAAKLRALREEIAP